MSMLSQDAIMKYQAPWQRHPRLPGWWTIIRFEPYNSGTGLLCRIWVCMSVGRNDV